MNVQDRNCSDATVKQKIKKTLGPEKWWRWVDTKHWPMGFRLWPCPYVMAAASLNYCEMNGPVGAEPYSQFFGLG
jgi:hypothetical protein